MDTTQSIPAAWYDDPAGSGGLRWWDGEAWSDHVRPIEAPSFPAFQPAQQPQPVSVTSSPEYSPFKAQVSPGTPAWSTVAPPAVIVNNSAGWMSLGAGVVGLAIVVVPSLLGTTTYVLYAPLAIAVIFGIRSLALYASGRSTTIVPPVLGILSGVIGALLFLSVVLTGSFLGIEPSNEISAQSASEKFPDSPELAAMYAMSYDIQVGIHEQYPEGNYPDSVTADPNGVIDLNGQTLGTLAEGQLFVYKLVDAGSFTFTIFGTQAGERMVYDSDKNQLTVECYSDDTACHIEAHS